MKVVVQMCCDRSRPLAVPLFTLTVACLVLLTATGAGAGVRPQERIKIQSVIVMAKQITIPLRRGLGVQVFGKAGSDPRLRVKLNNSFGPEREIAVPSPDLRVPSFPILGVNFLGLLANGTTNPPDTHGAVGPSHVMTMLNSQVHIQTKTGVGVSGWPVDLEAFWAPAGGEEFFFDPRIIYDSNTGRWLATVLSEFAIHLAIHPGPDPSAGSWSFFTIPADPTDAHFPDFPDIGCNVNWIALTVIMYNIAADALAGSAMWAIERPIPLAGPAVVHTFPTGFDSVGGAFGLSLRPCLTFDPVDTLYIVDNSDFVDGATGLALLRLSRLTGPVNAPVWSVQPGSDHGSSGLFSVPAANDFLYDPPDAAQLGTATRIATNNGKMLEAIFRNGHVWCTHHGGFPVPANSQCSVFWYELDPQKMPAPILQAGVIDGGTDVHHYYPSLAVDASDNMVVGFSRSHQGIYVQGAFTDRDAAMAPGTVGPVQVLKAGAATYERKRWGDYSATVIDPADDTFWTFQEYIAAPGGGLFNRWGTWWGQIDVIVPVQFQSLQAVAIDEAVELSWEISGDEPLAGFDIYRKDHGASGEFTVVDGGLRLAPEARLFIDDSVWPGLTYDYMISAVKPDGTEVWSPTTTVSIAAAEFSLSQNYPNPFYPRTKIEFALPNAARVTFSVYDPQGKLVARWVEDVHRGGRHVATWDGRDSNDNLVSTGVYFYQLRAENKVLAKKMIVLK
jgi:hypothetical protein